MRHLLRRTVVVGLLTVAGTGIVASTAAAAHPHFVSTSATVAAPDVTAPANLTWDTSLVVHFKVAGLGNNQGVTVGLNASGTGFANVVCGAPGGTAVAAVEVAATQTATASAGASCLDGTSVTATATESTGEPVTLSSDKNGNVSGTLTLSADTTVDSSPAGTACAYIDWTGITLTVGSTTVNLPDVTRKYDNSGGTLCSFS